MNRHNVSASAMQDLLDMLHICIDRRLTVCKSHCCRSLATRPSSLVCLPQWHEHVTSKSHALRLQMQLREVEQCHKAAAALIEDDASGWLVKEFTHDLLAAPLKLYYRDSAQWLSRQYGLKKYQGHFATAADTKLNAAQQRVYSAPQNCDAWIELQKAHGGARIAAIQVFSDKTVVNFKGLSVWPCRFALLNAAIKVNSSRQRYHECFVTVSAAGAVNVALIGCQPAVLFSCVIW